MRRFATAAIAALAAMTLAGAAKAATIWQYNLDVSEVAAFANKSVGTVTVMDQGYGYLQFDVSLDPGYEFNLSPNSNHTDVTFDLDKTGKSITNIATNLAPHTQFFQETGSSFDNQPFKGFDYAIGCKTTSCQTGYHPTKNPTDVKFRVAGININDLKSVSYTPKTPKGAKPIGIFFAVDVVNRSGDTGAVGASTYFFSRSFTPEPATWAMMIMGFGGIGAVMRRRRRTALLAAA